MLLHDDSDFRIRRVLKLNFSEIEAHFAVNPSRKSSSHGSTAVAVCRLLTILCFTPTYLFYYIAVLCFFMIYDIHPLCESREDTLLAGDQLALSFRMHLHAR